MRRKTITWLTMAKNQTAPISDAVPRWRRQCARKRRHSSPSDALRGVPGVSSSCYLVTNVGRLPNAPVLLRAPTQESVRD
jgi:hypothetical protein